MFLKDLGISNISIAEGAWLGARTDDAFKICGYNDLAYRYGIKLIDLKKDKFIETKVPFSASSLKTIKIAKTILEASKIVNIPVLKAHCQSLVTCGMKNLMGTISDSEKRRFHENSLGNSIFELNTILKPTMNLCDAIIGDLTFEEGGTPIKFGRIFISFDIYSFDCYASNILGYTQEEIEYLRLYRDYFKRTDTYELVEINPPKDIPDFKAIDYRSRFSASIHTSDACCSCLASIFTFLESCENEVSDMHFYVGTHVSKDSISNDGKRVFIGNCNKKYADLGYWVPGCPPNGIDIKKVIVPKS